MTDIINYFAGLSPQMAQLRARRADAVANAQLSFSALLEPEHEDGNFRPVERYAVAAFVAGIYGAGKTAEFYCDLLEDCAPPLLSNAVKEAIAHGISTGPYSGGGFITFENIPRLGPRLVAAFDFAHLLVFHPKDASPQAIGHLQGARWCDDAIVSLSQLVAFLSFQLRVIDGLAVLEEATGLEGATGQASVRQQAADLGQAGIAKQVTGQTTVRSQQQPLARGAGITGWSVHPRTQTPTVHPPAGFVNYSLGWKPWLAPLSKQEFTPEHIDALIRPERIDSEYFRLLARDPAALKARTLTDLDIFYNTDGGLGRAERELAATVVSRFNGCEYCASVHQQRSKEEGGDPEVIDRLLREGIDADLGSKQWNVIRDACRALTVSPFAFSAGNVTALRDAGLDDLAIIDLINSASFFNWANRLMLSLGAPDVPKRYR